MADDWLARSVAWALVRDPIGWGRPCLVVRVDEQRMYVWQDGRAVETYPVSTAARGTGNREGSLQTPLGLHRIAEKIGDGRPWGTIFRGRRDTGEILQKTQRNSGQDARDGVTSRILWLDGLQPGLNRGGEVDSYSRYIYIHGTDEEDKIGQPASHGCVRMHNDHIMDLFPRVTLNTLVQIQVSEDPENL